MSSANRFRFRAWDGVNKVMVVMEPLVPRVGGLFAESKFLQLRSSDQTIMQSTGLLDKNGKEIFEGDILAHRYSGMSDSEKSFIGVVEYHADKIIEIGFENSETRFTGYVLKCDNRPIIDEYYYSNICHLAEHEVVGNRFENPELLEAGE